MPHEHPMMSREEYERRFPDFPAGDAAPRQDRLEDIAADWGYPGCDEGVRWLIEEVARLRLSGDGTPPTESEDELDEDVPNEWYDAAVGIAADDPGNMLEGVINVLWGLHRKDVLARSEALRGRAEPAEGERREIKEARPE